MGLLNWYLYGFKPYELSREEKLDCIRELMEMGVLKTEEVMSVIKETAPSE